MLENLIVACYFLVLDYTMIHKLDLKKKFSPLAHTCSIYVVHCFNLSSICSLGLAKWDLWGLEAESWFVVASYAFAKTVFANPNIAHNMTYIKLLCREHQIARSSR